MKRIFFYIWFKLKVLILIDILSVGTFFLFKPYLRNFNLTDSSQIPSTPVILYFSIFIFVSVTHSIPVYYYAIFHLNQFTRHHYFIPQKPDLIPLISTILLGLQGIFPQILLKNHIFSLIYIFTALMLSAIYFTTYILLKYTTLAGTISSVIVTSILTTINLITPLENELQILKLSLIFLILSLLGLIFKLRLEKKHHCNIFSCKYTLLTKKNKPQNQRIFQIFFEED